MFGRLVGCYIIYTFLGALAPDRILPGAKFTLRRSLAFSCWAAITLGIGPHSILVYVTDIDFVFSTMITSGLYEVALQRSEKLSLGYHWDHRSLKDAVLMSRRVVYQIDALPLQY